MYLKNYPAGDIEVDEENIPEKEGSGANRNPDDSETQTAVEFE